MKVERSRRLLQALLDRADVAIDGERPWDLRVSDARFFGRVLAGGSLALGEAYMDGWWDCDALDEFVEGSCAGSTAPRRRSCPPPAVGLLWLDRLCEPPEARAGLRTSAAATTTWATTCTALMLDRR